MNALYTGLAAIVERALQIPRTPAPPPGDEGTTRVFRASPRYFSYRFLAFAVGRLTTLLLLLVSAVALLPALQATPLSDELAVGLFVLLFALFLLQTLVSYVALRLDYEKRWYLVTNRSLRIRQGVVAVSEMTITFANIQNISVSQGPLQRWFGISDLRVDTAGGSGQRASAEHAELGLHTAYFRGVDNPESIRTLMQERLRRLKDAGLGDPDDARPSERPPAVEVGQDATLGLLRQIRAEARALRHAIRRDPAA